MYVPLILAAAEQAAADLKRKLAAGRSRQLFYIQLGSKINNAYQMVFS